MRTNQLSFSFREIKQLAAGTCVCDVHQIKVEQQRTNIGIAYMHASRSIGLYMHDTQSTTGWWRTCRLFVLTQWRCCMPCWLDYTLAYFVAHSCVLTSSAAACCDGDQIKLMLWPCDRCSREAGGLFLYTYRWCMFDLYACMSSQMQQLA